MKEFYEKSFESSLLSIEYLFFFYIFVYNFLCFRKEQNYFNFLVFLYKSLVIIWISISYVCSCVQ